MSFSEKARDFLFFFGGILLGILGNLLAEFVVAYRFPDGVIPKDVALLSIIALCVVIFAETIVVGIYTLK